MILRKFISCRPIFLSTKNFAGQLRPRVEVHTIWLDAHEIDVLISLYLILVFIYFSIFLESTDDTKIVSYHWEEVNGPFREEKISADSPVLHLSNLVPGNYTFRQVASVSSPDHVALSLN